MTATAHNAEQPASGQTRPLQVAMLAIDGALVSAMSAPLDAFRVANALHQKSHPGAPEPFQLHLVSARKSREVVGAGGLRLSGIQPMPQQLDLLMVPGLDYRFAADLLARLNELKAEQSLLSRMHDAGCQLAASCSGTLLMAASGILDGKRATTSWWLAPIFQRSFPAVSLDANALYVESGTVATAGAATAMFTVVLRFIEAKLGKPLAQNTARILLVDIERQSQAAFISEAMLSRPRSVFSERVERFLRTHLADPRLNIESLAEHCRMSPRTLARRFKTVYHMSPLGYLQQLRIQNAKLLLESSALTLDDITEKIGYKDIASFRKLFKRTTHLTPVQYRDRFGMRGP